MLCFAGLVSAAALALAADTAVDAILGKLRPQLVADISDLRGVACMESVERTRYAPRRPSGNATCGELIAAAGATPGGAPAGEIIWHSRLRLDVTAGDGGENFALTDARDLERNNLGERSDVGGILRAADAGSGEFSTFLRNLINGDGASFQARGVQASTEPLLAFGFTVPEDKSHFLYASPVRSAGSAPIRAAYKGSLYMVPQSGDLKRLMLEAEDVGDACRVQYSTNYSPTRLGSREVMLPQSSTMEVLYRNGTELRSETYYSGCRRPATQAAAAAVAGDTPKPLPAGVRFRIRFQPPIDTETAATGDPVVGVIRATVKDKQNGVLMRAGDRVHGRIALIEEYMSPAPRWNLAIAMETIERGVGAHGIDQGVEQTVSLVPLDDGDREPHDETMGAEEMQRMRPPGGGYFIFHDPNVVLDQKFETEWETR